MIGVRSAGVRTGAPRFPPVFPPQNDVVSPGSRARAGGGSHRDVGLSVRRAGGAGFAAGGVLAPALLFRMAYCERCQMYMRSPTTRPPAHEREAPPSQQEEPRAPGKPTRTSSGWPRERGAARLQELAELARRNGWLTVLKAAVDQDNKGGQSGRQAVGADRDAPGPLPACLDAHLQPVSLERAGKAAAARPSSSRFPPLRRSPRRCATAPRRSSGGAVGQLSPRGGQRLRRQDLRRRLIRNHSGKVTATRTLTLCSGCGLSNRNLCTRYDAASEVAMAATYIPMIPYRPRQRPFRIVHAVLPVAHGTWLNGRGR